MAVNETSLINVIAINGTAGGTLPGTALPAKGTNIAGTAWGTAWTLIGARDRGHDVDLDEASVTWPFGDEIMPIKAPRANAAQKHILKSAGAREWEFDTYEYSEDIAALDSALTVSSHTAVAGTTLTNRTVAVEIDGLGVVQFPSCVVTVTQAVAGYGEDGVLKAKIKIRPEGVSGTLGGYKWNWYQSA